MILLSIAHVPLHGGRRLSSTRKVNWELYLDTRLNENKWVQRASHFRF